MVGAWCFVDCMGPGLVDDRLGLDVGPHPHIGLQTVTWLLEGAVLHRDSLGSEQLIRPGQLNLMTAGRGVSHSEETRGAYIGPLHGVQLWVAQPASSRGGDPAFEHHAELPTIEIGAATGTVLVGSCLGVESPARRDTDHSGVDFVVRPGRMTLPAVGTHEHAVLALGDGVFVDGEVVPVGHLAYLGPGRDELVIDASSHTRIMVLSGEPFPEQILMWWNYVARTRDEIIEAHQQWSDGGSRFGSVASPLGRVDVAGPPWTSSSRDE